MDRRAVGLVEAGLEDVGNAELLGHLRVFGAATQYLVKRLEDVDTSKKGKCLIVFNFHKN